MLHDPRYCVHNVPEPWNATRLCQPSPVLLSAHHRGFILPCFVENRDAPVAIPWLYLSRWTNLATGFPINNRRKQRLSDFTVNFQPTPSRRFSVVNWTDIWTLRSIPWWSVAKWIYRMEANSIVYIFFCYIFCDFLIFCFIVQKENLQIISIAVLQQVARNLWYVCNRSF